MASESASDTSSVNTHVILLAHGSRDANWLDAFSDGLKQMQPLLASPASVAFMELASPSLQDVVTEQVNNNVERFYVIPMFFAAGKHLLEDIPAMIRDLEALHSGISIQLGDPIGKDLDFWTFLAHQIDNQWLPSMEAAAKKPDSAAA
ncbi:Sirohydrochlorin cobaltochelatase [BD1-7 clade bacterium]|uniref:Sirohydrochlorin cobaltochelatase n=1 Tax=BD1-7 clade bacterium TaxID=2029982 RepID=A0A5S9QSF2_9GAMM|nr:Sirohydrochlorin cobaltochelatase [BD1-7 clade bacterium]CAA0122254.1 Sirohydrochlorin cobaltochelatase [BD1-7 clade bacterium]